MDSVEETEKERLWGVLDTPSWSLLVGMPPTVATRIKHYAFHLPDGESCERIDPRALLYVGHVAQCDPEWLAIPLIIGQMGKKRIQAALARIGLRLGMSKEELMGWEPPRGKPWPAR